MKKGILLVIFLLVACTAPVVPVSTSTVTVGMNETITETQSAFPTLTLTNAIITPTATRPAYTATPQPPATCPSANDKVRIPLAAVFKDKNVPFHDARATVLNYLNEGGNPQTAIEKLAEFSVNAYQLDLTHDGVPEFTLSSGYLTVFGCKDGKYVNLLDIPPLARGMAAVPLVIEDLNQNGLLELLIGQVESMDVTTYRIYEWDGTRFAEPVMDTFNSSQNNIYIQHRTVFAVGQSNAEKGALEGNWEIVDIDENGLKDIVIRAGIYSNYLHDSDLEHSLVLKWEGDAYVIAGFSTEFTATPTPTFTPLPFSATCAYKVPELRFKEPEFSDAEKTIVDYLNAGGNPEQFKGFYDATIKDLNNDAAPEILLINRDTFVPYIMMFTCQDGKYIKALDFPHPVGSFQIGIMSVKDNNKNSFPEVFIEDIGCFNLRCGALYVVEWDGNHFVQRIKDFDLSGEVTNYTRMDDPHDAYLKDLDNDGVAELIWTGELTPDWHTDHWAFYPQRLATHVFKWDGMNYSAQLVEYSSPEYRFQAVQDGDRYSKAGFYEKALQSYQQAISSDALKWWTEDLYNYIIAPYGIGPCADNQSACRYPTSDPAERPVLSAYALFRKMIVHLLINDSVRAETTYQNLLTTHPVNTPAYKITEMAKSFWTEYQSSHDVGKACARSIATVKNQRYLLLYLTGAKNGQGIAYENNLYEMCPFK